jgi:hypothetical protein
MSAKSVIETLLWLVLSPRFAGRGFSRDINKPAITQGISHERRRLYWCYVTRGPLQFIGKNLEYRGDRL